MFYIYLTTFSLEISHYIVGAENRFQPKFHGLICISFLHGFPSWFNTHDLPQAGRGQAPTLPGTAYDSFLIFFWKESGKRCQWRVSCVGFRDTNLSNLTLCFKINILSLFQIRIISSESANIWLPIPFSILCKYQKNKL
jgi:hypothetical protein